MTSFQDCSFLIVGLARNCEQNLSRSISGLREAFSFAKKLNILVVESDSTDGTLNVLKRLSTENKTFDYETLGTLRIKLPKRTDRIAFCRNHYLKLINESSKYKNIDYVVVADLDGVNDKLTSGAVTSCWSRNDWDVCAANQDGPYYDIWALRHPLWSPNDCWEQVEFLINSGLSRFKSIFSSVYSRMIKISTHADWVEVESAFGGLAIYRKTIIQSVTYVGLTSKDKESCEHVSLHKQIRENGGRIFINPKMINTGSVAYTKNARGAGIVFFWFQCQLWDLAQFLKIIPHLKKTRAFLKDFFR